MFIFEKRKLVAVGVGSGMLVEDGAAVDVAFAAAIAVTVGAAGVPWSSSQPAARGASTASVAAIPP